MFRLPDNNRPHIGTRRGRAYERAAGACSQDQRFDTPVGCGLMFGKKLVKGFLVDTNAVLMKEFLFSSKGEVTYDQVRAGFQGKGSLATIGAFEVGKHVATVVKGDKMNFIAVGRDVMDDEDVTFLKELLSSVEKSFDATIEVQIGRAHV